MTPAIGTAVAGVDDDELARQRGPGAGDRLGLAHRVRPAADDRAAELVQRLEGGRPAGAVGHDADVALELAQRLLGLDAEQAVDPAAVEAHVQQPLLQGGDVVAGHQPGRHEEQDAVAEPPAGLVERVVGPRPDDAVDREAALLLERAHGAVGRLVEQRTGRVQQRRPRTVGEQPEHGSASRGSRRPPDRCRRGGSCVPQCSEALGTVRRTSCAGAPARWGGPGRAGTPKRTRIR